MTDTPRNVLLEIAEMFDAMPHEDPSLEIGFDMRRDWGGRYISKHPCGLAMCIGGWVQKIVPETQAFSFVDDAVISVAPNMSKECATDLCYNGDAIKVQTTPQQAAQAIRNALTYDDPKWSEVLA